MFTEDKLCTQKLILAKVIVDSDEETASVEQETTFVEKSKPIQMKRIMIDRPQQEVR